MRVAVFGLGYVGTVTAAGLAASGHDVVGVDVDPLKVEAIRAGRSPVVEPGIDALVADGVASGALRATTDARVAMDRADVSLICVGTPSAPHGDTDLTYISRALRDLADAMSTAEPPATGHHSVVIRSTVPPGTGDVVVRPIFAGELPAGWSIGTAMCPEFLREGCGLKDFYDPPFVVIGTADPRTHGTLAELFAFVPREPHRVDVRTAEALKYACNAFHANKVSFANEMARIFRLHGVDSRQVMDIFVEDTKLNIAPTYLRPGFAFGGSCLPKDLRALLHMARAAGVDAPLLSGTVQTNELVVRDLVERVAGGRHRRVAILGLSFKMDTDDLRESPNVELAERLIGKGFDITIYDPIINPARLVGANLRHIQAHLPHLGRLLTSTPEDALARAGVAIVATSEPGVLASLVAADPDRVIDLHGRLGPQVEALSGYEGVGW